MFAIDMFLHNHHNKTVLASLLCFVLGCNFQQTPVTGISPESFKVTAPFMVDDRGIIINTYWGTEKTHHVLCLDNYSPSWIKSSAVTYSRSFTKSANTKFKTSTADGSPIQGNVGICDRLSFEDITFSNVPFYVMPRNNADTETDDGVFGGDLMAKGVWKIDFKKHEVTFTSSIDSLPEAAMAEEFPAHFDQQSITLDVKFGNNKVKKMAIDLGYKGDFLLPTKEFNELSKQKKVYDNQGMFKTPAGQTMVNKLFFLDTVTINRNFYFAEVTSNAKAKEQLIGLSFFGRFDFVIFDFINNKVFLPRKVW